MRVSHAFAQRMAIMRWPHLLARHAEPISSTAGFGRSKMSAIAHPKFHVSAHAEYRRSDYMFSRSQSRELSQREWEARLPGLRSWSNVVIPALTAAAAMAAALAALS